MAFQHTTVLLNETIDYLNPKENGIYVDATFGGGGHFNYLTTKISSGKVFGFDQDEYAINEAKKKYDKFISGDNALTLELIHSNFENLRSELNERGVNGIDGIVYDLGVSSPQFDDAKRGFSYKKEARLDMRMDQEQELDAYQIVNEWSFNDLLRILTRYGDEKFAKNIARAIEKRREVAPIVTTTELSELIKEAIPAFARRTGGHPAKKSFQALRIAVNHELDALETSLQEAIDILNPGGRISVITFQPLEDRIVKHIFRDNATVDIPRNIPIVPDHLKPKLEIISKKPILPTIEELEVNNRSHSAKLRVAQKM